MIYELAKELSSGILTALIVILFPREYLELFWPSHLVVVLAPRGAAKVSTVCRTAPR